MIASILSWVAAPFRWLARVIHGVIQALYLWVMRRAAGRHASWFLAIVAFAESSFFPIPPDVMLAPMVVARRERAYFYAAICTAASVAGGIAGYAIGYYSQGLGQALLAFAGHPGGLEEFQKLYAEVGVWVILVKGMTPIPYKLVTIASGLARFDFGVFVAASVVTRGARFFLTAWLLRRFGPALQEAFEKRMTMWTLIGLVVLVGAIVAVRFVHV